MTTDLKLHIDVVAIRYVNPHSSVDADGVQAWVIGAEKTSGDSLGERLISFRIRPTSNKNTLMLTLCKRALEKGFLLLVKYHKPFHFDYSLLHCETAKESAA